MSSFRAVIDATRNILRSEGITGMDSINHCLVFLICRCLDESLCTKLGIPKEFAFKNLFNDENGEEIKLQALYGKFFNPDASIDSLVYYINSSIGFTNAKFKLKSPTNLKTILDSLKKIDIGKLSETTDLVGIVYELHLKSGTSNAMRDLGQYFTHRLVIKYMIQICNPKVIKGKVEKIADPSMGTGGFLTMAVKFLNQHNKNIDWSKNQGQIYGFDIDESVKNMAALNLLLETGEKFNNMYKQDTLYNDMTFKESEKMVLLKDIDVILANEPMGLKNIIHASCCDRIKDLKIRGTKAEPLFLQLFMQALADKGRCAVVVPDGVLFNESELHKDTRKYLVENMNLKKIIILKDKDFFLNTGVSTSILYFVKDGNKTQEVEFVEIRMNKEQTEIIESAVVKVKYDDIKKNKYSLFVNKYVEIINEKKNEGFSYKKLNEILIRKSGKSLPRDKMINGEYPVIGGGVAFSGWHNEYNYNEKLIFIARVGSAGSVSCYTDKCYVTDLVGAYSVNEDGIEWKYVYYYLKNNENKIKDYAMKTAAPSINLSNLIESLEIPIPSLEIQKRIVERLDTISENNLKFKKRIEKNNILTKDIIDYYLKTKDIINENEAVNENNVEHIDENIEDQEDVKSVDDKPQIKQIKNSTSDKKKETKSIISSIGIELETKSDESKTKAVKKTVIVKGKKTVESKKEDLN